MRRRHQKHHQQHLCKGPMRCIFVYFRGMILIFLNLYFTFYFNVSPKRNYKNSIANLTSYNKVNVTSR